MSESKSQRPPSRVDRRSFIRAAGGTTIAAVGGSSLVVGAAQGATPRKWDHEVDVVVVGSGGAALAGAVTAVSRGLKVAVLEAAPVAGGATARSGGGYWIPNNRFMRAKGIQDPREDCIRYMARYSFTQLYDVNAENYGIPVLSVKQMAAMYDNAAPAVELFEKLGALQTREDDSYDYWEAAPENKAPQGRLIWTKVDVAPGTITGGGADTIRQMGDWLAKKGSPIQLEHRVTKLVTNSKGAVVGVIATDSDDKQISFRARRGVHFGSGGFTLNEELRLNFQRGPVFGSCGPMTNQGDLVYMASAIGAKLGNMQNGWRFQLVLDQVLQTPGLATDVWGVIGDSMVMVNKYGQRVVNEKRPYSDRGEVHFNYDPNKNEWTNLVLMQILDQRAYDHAQGHYPLPPKGATAPYIITAPTLDALADAIRKRLTEHGPRIGGFQLDESFLPNLKATIKRFNGFAETGNDEDFARGSFGYDRQWHERFGGPESIAANDKPNKTMYPIADKGPYHAILLVSGSADTNGGPMINENAQVLSIANEPIPGLYGAGNCIASPSGRAYWGGGATIGLSLTFGYIAGNHLATAPINDDA
ncbi:FAD-dependent oxidoreductase [Sphingosinicella xenopeptidilytica]|uniref:FAD-dependent oxidoreductase n=1 Tax=Sphingosinicella xenopeptidilytica TaxID=364098 RepID=A0ABW3C4A4_SPHXN